MSLLKAILDFIFGNSTQKATETQEQKRPYTDINSTKVGEVKIDNPQFTNSTGLKYSITNVPEFIFTCIPMVSGNVTFRVYADNNKDDLNNPELQTATFTEGGASKQLRFRMKMQAARQVGMHTISVDQICWTARRADGARVYTTYSTDTYTFEVTE